MKVHIGTSVLAAEFGLISLEKTTSCNNQKKMWPTYLKTPEFII